MNGRRVGEGSAFDWWLAERDFPTSLLSLGV